MWHSVTYSGRNAVSMVVDFMNKNNITPREVIKIDNSVNIGPHGETYKTSTLIYYTEE